MPLTHTSEDAFKIAFSLEQLQVKTDTVITSVDWVMFQMIASSKVSHMPCENGWGLLCWRARESQDGDL